VTKTLTNQKQLILFYLFLIAFGVFFRLVPSSDYNFTPLLAISIVSGLFFKQNYWSYLLPLFIVLICDSIEGFYPGFEFVYLGLAFCVLAGAIKVKSSFEVIFKFFASTLGFYIISNLGVWIYGGLYPITIEGLVNCFYLALPFYKATLLSTFVFLVLFSVLELTLLRRSSWSILNLKSENYGR
jgi:hypothetical protein